VTAVDELDRPRSKVSRGAAKDRARGRVDSVGEEGAQVAHVALCINSSVSDTNKSLCASEREETRTCSSPRTVPLSPSPSESARAQTQAALRTSSAPSTHTLHAPRVPRPPPPRLLALEHLTNAVPLALVEEQDRGVPPRRRREALEQARDPLGVVRGVELGAGRERKREHLGEEGAEEVGLDAGRAEEGAQRGRARVEGAQEGDTGRGAGRGEEEVRLEGGG